MKRTLIAFILILLLTGCSYSIYNVQVIENVPSNPYDIKFYPLIYPNSHGQGIHSEVDVAKNEQWVQALTKKYPDYFTANSSEGIPIVFEWKIDHRMLGKDQTTLIAGYTFGAIPLQTKGYFYASLTARYQGSAQILDPIDNAGYLYKIKAESVEMPFFFLSLLSYPIVAISMAADDDIDFDTSLYSMNFIPNPLYGYALCEKNLRLFPLACLQMMNRPITFEELQIGSKYFPHLKTYLNNLTDQQRQLIIANETQRAASRQKFANYLEYQFNYEYMQMERRVQVISAASQIITSGIATTGNIISAATVPPPQAPTYSAPAASRSEYRSEDRSTPTKSTRRSSAGTGYTTCPIHGTIIKVGKVCTACLSEKMAPDAPDFAD